MKSHYLKGLLGIGFLILNLTAAAEDIDLFVGNGQKGTNLPNVILVIDNAANFSANDPSTGSAQSTCTVGGKTNTLSGTVGGIEQCALYNVINALPADAVNVAVMVYNGNNVVDYLGTACNASGLGGCLVYPMTQLSSANKTTLLNWIASWKTSGSGAGYIKANNEVTGASMQEAWAYYAGRTGLSTTPYAGINPANNGCQKDYLVFIGNSYTSSGSPADQTGNKGPLSALSGTNSNALMNASPAATSSQITAFNPTITTALCGAATLGTPHENNGYYADEWTRYMKAQGITTYTVGVLGNKCQANYAALLTSMADLGGGKYFPTTDYTGLTIALETIFSEVLSFNSVFTSVSLPVSVNTQGTYLNQVYIGMFRPDPDALPRWVGNLKQYKLGLVNNTLQTQDADGNNAISSAGTGFIAECARSYWTPKITDPGEPDTYWNFKPQNNCLSVANSDVSDTPDGNIVEKGGQGYKLRHLTTTRTVKTCSDASCTGLTDYGSGADTNDTAALINWELGLDVQDENTNGATLTEIRPSVHGDVVHSRPVAINFATGAGADNLSNAKVVVFYGANDGMLHAVNGNRDGGLSIGSAGPGQELWAFVAPEFYANTQCPPSPATCYTPVQRLSDNKTEISFLGNTTVPPAPTPLPKPYGVDGPITAYQAGGNTWIYATMRRGGRALYAFDVTTPGSPSVMWKKSNGNLSGLGQTWSSAKSFRASGYGSGTSPMLIMGGGYDNTCEDADPYACASPAMGNHIYVLDAQSGNLLRTLDTVRPVTGDVFVVTDIDTGGTGIAQWAYVADLGGNIYRISGADANTPFNSTPPGNWTITKIASLGGSGTSARKFMFAPDVVRNTDGSFSLLIGSGDREKPLKGFTSAYDVQNYFFMVKDQPTDSTWLSSENATCGANVICKASLGALSFGCPTDLTQTATSAVTGTPTAKGWALQFCPHEQSVTSAITVFGVATFSTHTPAVPVAGACTSNLGTARVYNINYTNAASANGDTSPFGVVAGGGLPPSPVAGKVTLSSEESGTGQPLTVPFLIGGNTDSPLGGGSPTGSPSLKKAKHRVYWYIQQ